MDSTRQSNSEKAVEHTTNKCKSHDPQYVLNMFRTHGQPHLSLNKSRIHGQPRLSLND